MAAIPGDVGIILVDHGSKRAEANDLLLEVTEMFRRDTGAAIVEPAHMELAEPSIAQAVQRCVDRGVIGIEVNSSSPGALIGVDGSVEGERVTVDLLDNEALLIGIAVRVAYQPREASQYAAGVRASDQIAGQIGCADIPTPVVVEQLAVRRIGFPLGKHPRRVFT